MTTFLENVHDSKRQIYRSNKIATRRWSLDLPACRNSQEGSGVTIQHSFPLAVGAIHLLDLFRRHPVAEVERVIGSHHNVFGADHALQILHRLDPVNEIVEIKIL